MRRCRSRSADLLFVLFEHHSRSCQSGACADQAVRHFATSCAKRAEALFDRVRATPAPCRGCQGRSLGVPNRPGRRAPRARHPKKKARSRHPPGTSNSKTLGADTHTHTQRRLTCAESGAAKSDAALGQRVAGPGAGSQHSPQALTKLLSSAMHASLSCAGAGAAPFRRVRSVGSPRKRDAKGAETGVPKYTNSPLDACVSAIPPTRSITLGSHDQGSYFPCIPKRRLAIVLDLILHCVFVVGGGVRAVRMCG